MSDYLKLQNTANIKVVGLGAGGSDVLNSIAELQLCPSIGFIAVDSNTDALVHSPAAAKTYVEDHLLQLEESDDTSEASIKALDKFKEGLKSQLADTDMLFIAANMDDAIGAQIAPFVAQIAKELGVLLTIGVATSTSESKYRSTKLHQLVDTMAWIQKQQEYAITSDSTNDIHLKARTIKSIIDILVLPSFIGIDFEDIRGILQDGGVAHVGIGEGAGSDRAEKAAEGVLNSFALHASLKDTQKVLFSMSGSSDMAMAEVDTVARIIDEATAPTTGFIFGAVIDDSLSDKIEITLVASENG